MNKWTRAGVKINNIMTTLPIISVEGFRSVNKESAIHIWEETKSFIVHMLETTHKKQSFVGGSILDEKGAKYISWTYVVKGHIFMIDKYVSEQTVIDGYNRVASALGEPINNNYSLVGSKMLKKQIVS